MTDIAPISSMRPWTSAQIRDWQFAKHSKRGVGLVHPAADVDHALAAAAETIAWHERAGRAVAERAATEVASRDQAIAQLREQLGLVQAVAVHASQQDPYVVDEAMLERRMAAQQEADEMVAQAEAQAEMIVSQASTQADGILARANDERDRIVFEAERATRIIVDAADTIPDEPEIPFHVTDSDGTVRRIGAVTSLTLTKGEPVPEPEPENDLMASMPPLDPTDLAGSLRARGQHVQAARRQVLEEAMALAATADHVITQMRADNPREVWMTGPDRSVAYDDRMARPEPSADRPDLSDPAVVATLQALGAETETHDQLVADHQAMRVDEDEWAHDRDNPPDEP